MLTPEDQISVSGFLHFYIDLRATVPLGLPHLTEEVTLETFKILIRKGENSRSSHARLKSVRLYPHHISHAPECLFERLTPAHDNILLIRTT